MVKSLYSNNGYSVVEDKGYYGAKFYVLLKDGFEPWEGNGYHQATFDTIDQAKNYLNSPEFVPHGIKPAIYAIDPAGLITPTAYTQENDWKRYVSSLV